jgi:alkanesulfonate monooxygenase SsuD/methylene tetrahydromethanopterin reductase-like flavin-dependent oxidoreductase (luciferase family)
VVRSGEAPIALALGDAGSIEFDGPHVRLDASDERPAPFARVDLLFVASVEAAVELAARFPGARRHLTRPNRVR